MLISDLRPTVDYPISLHLLGHPKIYLNGLRVDSGIPVQSLLLLSLLVTRKGEGTNRDEAAFILWPDLAESEARASLRRQLYNLQRVFATSELAPLRCTAKALRWDPNSEAWADITEFERLIQSPHMFEAAANLYSGDFAPYVDHEWAGNLREQLRRKLRCVLEELLQRSCSRGNIAQALEYAERLLREDPWREDVVRQFMLLRFRTGDRAGALAYYRRFCERLRSEFEVEPMPETLECHDIIVRGLPVAKFLFEQGLGRADRWLA